MPGVNEYHAWVKPSIYSLILHVAILLLLVVRLDSPRLAEPKAAGRPIQAQVVDASKVSKAVQDLRQKERKREEAERQRQAKLQETEQKLKQAQAQRAAEEKKVAEAQAKRVVEEKKAVEVQAKRAAEEKKVAEAQAKRVAEEKKAAEEKAKQAALEKAKAEQAKQQALKEEKARQQAIAAKQKQRQEADALARKKRAAEEALRLQQEAALREQQLAEEQAEFDEDEVSRFTALIRRQVSSNWRQPPGWNAASRCDVAVKLIPSGEVIEARVVSSCGGEVFDRSVEAAVLSASPLPVPTGRLFHQQFRNFTFEFKGTAE